MAVTIKEDRHQRSYAEIKKTYELEKKLAQKLKEASKRERLNVNLYTEVYDDFFNQLPKNPVQNLKDNP